MTLLKRCFPKEQVKSIFKKYSTEKVEIFNVLTNTDSISLKFIFISSSNSEIPQDKYYSTVAASKIYTRFYSSHIFWELFTAREKQKKTN